MKRLWIELTKRCNLFCTHCFIVRKAAPSVSQSSEVNSDFLTRIITEAANLSCESIEFTGGEPLIRKDFVRTYLHAHQTDMALSVTTNGTLISAEVADLWLEHRPKQIKISFYGWDEQSYAGVVDKPGAFRLFVAGLERLGERGIPFRMLVPAHPMLLPNIERLHDFGKRYGAVGRVSVGWELMLHSCHDIEANRCIRSMRPSPTDAARQKMQFPELVYADISLIQNAKHGQVTPDTHLFRCVAGDQSLAIDSYGFLQPCRPLFNPTLSFDLNQGSLRQAVEEHMPKVRTMRIQSTAGLERCARCALRSACLSCPATSWMENSTLDAPVQYHCDLIHQEAYWLGLLELGKKGWQ